MPSCYRMLAGTACALALLCPLPALAESGSSASPSVQTLNRIVAVVNDGVILASELEHAVSRLIARLEREGRPVPDRGAIRRRVLERLVLEKIQLLRAERRGIEVSDQAVNAALRNMAAKRGTDLAGLRARLPSNGMTFARLRANVRDQLTIARLRQREVASEVQVSESEVDAFLARIERATSRRQRYHLRHILIGLEAEPTSTEVAAARERAQAVIAKLRTGADFATLARRVSDGPHALAGGDLGWRRPTQLPGLFVEALAGMSVGEIAGPLRSPNGFHILKLVGQRGTTPSVVTEARVRHILLRDNGDETPRERLAELRRRLMEGADFGALARAYSEDRDSAADGGRLGWIGPTEMSPAFQDVLETLPAGQISAPFKGPNGWHLVKVLERRQRADVEERRRAEARRTLYRRQVQQRVDSWLDKLRDKTYVRLQLRERPAARAG